MKILQSIAQYKLLSAITHLCAWDEETETTAGEINDYLDKKNVGYLYLNIIRGCKDLKKGEYITMEKRIGDKGKWKWFIKCNQKGYDYYHNTKIEVIKL